MSTERKAKIIALACTAVIAGLVVLSLRVFTLTVTPMQKEKPQSEVWLLEEEEQFVETFEPQSLVSNDREDTQSYMPQPEKNQSQPTPAAGTDLENRGQRQDAPPKVVQSKEPSDVKVRKDTPKDAGSTVDKEKQKQEEEVKREATNEVANAFKNASGKHNSLTSNKSDNGNSGSDKVATTSQGTTGLGSGTVGGGWIVPKYGSVRSTVTGKVNISVRIDATGKVVSLEFTGGTPPAATDPTVRAAIEREIRAHKFSRSNYDNAEGATAYITYIFK